MFLNMFPLIYSDVPQEKFDQVVAKRDGLKTTLHDVEAQNRTFETQIASLEAAAISTDERQLFDEWKIAKEKKDAGQTMTLGEHQRVIADGSQKHKTELETLKSEFTAAKDLLDSEIDRLTVDNAIEMAVMSCGVEKTDEKDMISQVVTLIKPSVRREKTDDGYRVICVDSDNAIKQTSDGVMPVTDHVSEFLKANTQFLPSSGNGPRVRTHIQGPTGPSGAYWEGSHLDNIEALHNK